MYWNYRVLRHKNPDGSNYFNIHEVHYDEEGEPEAFTEDGIDPMGETLEDLKGDLAYMAKALEKPVLDCDELLETCRRTAKKREEEEEIGNFYSWEEVKEELGL